MQAERTALSPSQRAVVEALRDMTGDKTLRAIADRCGTTPAGAKRTLRSLEDRRPRLARELFDGRWS
jgi:DNA-binding MarR family transcriptional regulator